MAAVRREGKGREGKGREGKGRGGKGREGWLMRTGSYFCSRDKNYLASAQVQPAMNLEDKYMFLCQ